MTLRQLQDNLRRILLARIQAREFTGSGLAARIGLQQAHISNFLNNKRNLSLDAMDAVLEALDLGVLDLASYPEDGDRGFHERTSSEPYQGVPLVTPQVAATMAVVPRSRSLDELQFKKSFLRRLRAKDGGERASWTRFVLIRADAATAAAMHPRITNGATLLIDRHYSSLEPYRRGVPNLYAVLKQGSCVVRYVALLGNQLSLRPQSDAVALDYVTIAAGRSCGSYVVGRVCHIGMET